MRHDAFTEAETTRFSNAAIQMATAFGISCEMAATALDNLISVIRASGETGRVRNIISSQRTRRHK